jgi:hypothetical protein
MWCVCDYGFALAVTAVARTLIFLVISFYIHQATCYPAPQFREKLVDPVDDVVAVTGGGLITTSKGPGTALAFALELGEQLFGKEARDKIQKEMLVV